MKRAQYGLIATTLIAMGALAHSSVAEAADIRWGTSAVGSTGHRAVVAITQLLGKHMPEHNFTVQTTPGAILTVKGHAQGDFEGYYGSDIAFYELANNINRFEGFKDRIRNQTVQSFWAFTIEMGVGIHARDRETIKSWADLSGRPVFTGPQPWDTRAQLERALETLGVNHEYVAVDVKTAGSLLESGRIDAMGVYTNAQSTTAPWITEASLQADWAALKPTEEEVAKLKEAGFSVVEVPISAFGKDKTYSETATLLPFFYGLHLGLAVSEDDVYNVLKTIEANLDELVQLDKAFRQVADDMVAMQVRGITSSIKFVPIHPGLAKWLKEKNAWQDEWNDRIATAG